MVWSPTGAASTHRYGLEFDAKNESRRLAKLYPGKEFFVLKATHLSKCEEPVTTYELEEPDELPF